MKKLMTIAMMCVLSIWLAGCGSKVDKYEDLLRETTKIMMKIDPKAAKDAEKEIAKELEEFKKLDAAEQDKKLKEAEESLKVVKAKIEMGKDALDKAEKSK